MLVGEYGSNNQQIEQFACAIFDKMEEVTFQKFITRLFQYINMRQLSPRDQKMLLTILEDDSCPNEALKRTAKSYKEKYEEEPHLCYDCSKSCDCGGNNQSCDGCGCLQ
jgi:hypothetical protein